FAFDWGGRYVGTFAARREAARSIPMESHVLSRAPATAAQARRHRRGGRQDRPRRRGRAVTRQDHTEATAAAIQRAPWILPIQSEHWLSTNAYCPQSYPQ